MHHTKHRAVGGLLALLLAMAALGASPVPTVACSCAEPPALSAETFDPAAQAVFIGTIGPDELRGVRVDVERWYAGNGRAPVVWLDAGNFAPERQGGACGIQRLPSGTSWIMDAYRAEDGLFGVHLCSRQWQVATPEGQAMVTEARAAFGDGVPLGGGGPAPGFDLWSLILGLLRLLFGG